MGGGGDDGYEQRQQGIEQSKALARQGLNAMFGMGPSASEQAQVAAPDASKFMTQPGSAEKRYVSGDTFEMAPDWQSTFDQAGFDKATSEYQRQAGLGAQAQGNAQARDSLYQGVRDNAFTAGKRKLDEAQQDAARKLKFELFATGQAGGSGDIDENAKQKRTYNNGLIDLGAKADSAKAAFRNADEDTRLQLLQSIDNGMDQGSALSTATQRMQIAADKAAADANGTAVGDLFNTGSEFYNASQYARGRQAAQQQAFQMFPQQLGVGAKKPSAASGQVYSSNAYGDR